MVTLATVIPDAVLIGLVYLQYHLLPSGITTQVMDGIVPELTGIVLADEIFLGERPCYQSVVEELLQAFRRVDDAESEMFVGCKQDGMIVKQSWRMQFFRLNRDITDNDRLYAHCLPHLDIEGIGIRHAVKLFIGSELIDFAVLLNGEVHMPCGFWLVFLACLVASADE